MKDRKEQIDENSEMLIFFSNTSSVGFISITTHSRGEKRLRVENMLKEPFKKRHKPKNQPVTTAYDRTPTILNLSQFRSHFYNILYIKKKVGSCIIFSNICAKIPSSLKYHHLQSAWLEEHCTLYIASILTYCRSLMHRTVRESLYDKIQWN